MGVEVLHLTIDATMLVERFISGNRGADPLLPEERVLPNYGIKAFFDGSTIELQFVFKQGYHYCCDEFDCHLSLFEGARWNKLREVFEESDLEIPSRIRIKGECVIEAGSLFYDLSKPSRNGVCEYEYGPVVAGKYSFDVLEASA